MNLLVPRDFRDPVGHARQVRARLNQRLQRAVGGVAERYPSPPRPLATPPPGSGLKPVMGDFGPPWIGYMLSSLADPIDFSRRRLRDYGPVNWAGGFGRPIVGVGSPEALEQVMLDRDRVFSAQRGWEFLIGPFFRGGLLLRDFDDHLYHRRILQQVFTRPRLDGYLELTSPLLARGIADWRPGPDFRLYDAVKRLLLAQATAVFAGAELGPESNRLSRAFEDAVHGGTAMIRADVPGGVWHRGLRGRRMLEEYFRRELPRRRAGEAADLFSVLARVATMPEHRLTDADVIAHMIFVMMAAHDTSAISIAMLAYELARHPDWQERLRAESRALGKAELDYGDLARLPSLDLAFKEALRMYAPVAQQARETIADTDIAGHYVPAGTLVMTAPYTMMRQREFWRDPDAFEPERFDADHREDSAHRFAWAPFGGGAHKCIGLYFGGMTVKAVLHRMLLAYRWSVPPGYRVPLIAGTGPLPADGLPMRLERLGA
ncbi:cytochrome P450 [Nocardia otitidiscaviarum]|uniref:Cytochrome P450 n=1 Tax=Nocardia otitidiscaviarum TaxID=1823 RepID=A0A516NJS7_9NOCA|nr:cytochrome P450 [Nocardia otitidiscaviarum]MCP9620582.1 cytochrome P450 [Nocardia otitidiscaviarum]QDP79155.1 cytochrome P450 [Nocardia otitidiscaviarum]